MVQKTTHKYLFIILAAALLVLSLMNIMDIASELFFNTGHSTTTAENLMSREFSLINKALKTKSREPSFKFDGTYASPFNTATSVPKKDVSAMNQKQEVYKKLFLKGTLLKEDALAIIVDEDGKTYICKQGDHIENQVIANISDNTVTIRQGSQTTVLKVKEF